jgi:glyoxylase I family protein
MADLTLPAHNSASPFADMRGHHVCIRTPDFESAKRWYVEKLDFRLIFEFEFADMKLGYLAPPADDQFWLEILGGGENKPQNAHPYADLMDSLKWSGYHHFCMSVNDIDATVKTLPRARRYDRWRALRPACG